MAAITYKWHTITLSIRKETAWYVGVISVKWPTVNTSNVKTNPYKTSGEATVATKPLITYLQGRIDLWAWVTTPKPVVKPEPEVTPTPIPEVIPTPTPTHNAAPALTPTPTPTLTEPAVYGYTTEAANGWHSIAYKIVKWANGYWTAEVKVYGPKINETKNTPTSYKTATEPNILKEIAVIKKEYLEKIARAMEWEFNVPNSETPAPFSEDTPVLTVTAANDKVYIIYKNSLSKKYWFGSSLDSTLKKEFDTLNEAKAAIMKWNPNPKNKKDIALKSEVVWGWTRDPRPVITFGPGQWLTNWYQVWRNQQVGTMIANSMRWQKYNSETQAITAFTNLLRTQMATAWQEFDFWNDWANLLNNKTASPGWGTVWEARKRTYDKIKAAAFLTLWISSWSDVIGNVIWEEPTVPVSSWDAVEQAQENLSLEVSNPELTWMNDIVTATETENITLREKRLKKLPDFWANITTRVAELIAWINTARDSLKAAGDLEKRAQAIYSNENIRNMREQLVSKWFDVSKAGPAVFYQAMKARATMAADIMKIQADQEKTIAQLEVTSAQMKDAIRASGMEADKWLFDAANAITAKIQAIKEQADLTRATNTQNYVMKPMLDIFSWTREIELQNLAAKYQAQYVNANSSEKLVAAQKIFGSEFAYIDSSIMQHLNEPFGVFLVSVANILRANKQKYEITVGTAK